MSEFQRQHPVAAISRAFGLIKGNMITILVFLYVGSQSESFSFWIWLGGGAAFLLTAGFLNWWRFLFKIEDDTLHIKRGIFVRRDLYMTRDRVQVIDITSGIIERAFGLVRLTIQTAGSGSRQAVIEAISVDQANLINDQLMNKQATESDGEFPPEESSLNSDIIQTIRLPNKELLIAASTSGSFGIALSLIATLFSQIEPILSNSRFYEEALRLIPAQTDGMVVVTTILIFVIFAWLISFASTLLTFGNFQIDIKKDELVVSRGIFEKKKITVPFNRIQAIHITEGIIRQPLGYASVHLESAGYGDEQGSGSFVLMPLIKAGNILSFLEETVPGYYQMAPAIHPPAKALRRYIVRSSLIVTVVVAAAFWILELNFLIWILPALSILWGWLRYKAAAVGRHPDFFILRSRFISRSTAFIRRNRVQDMTLHQSIIQRYRGLCTLTIYVASGDHGKSFSVTDLDYEIGSALLESFITGGFHQPEELSFKSDSLPDWSRETIHKSEPLIDKRS